MTTLEKFDETKVYARHENAHPEGGVHLQDDPNSTVKTTEITLSLLKSVGAKVKEGKVLDLLKISRPAIISYPRTYLECVQGDFQHTHLLEQAALARKPVERLKLVTAFIVSGLYRNCAIMGNRAPLNPILGETFTAEKEDGTKLYCEQISHHPPVSAYLIQHPKGLYRLHGKGEVAAKLGGLNHICGSRIGETVIDFKDGTRVVVTNPDMRIDGVMMGARTLNYVKSFLVTDVTDDLVAEVSFNYNEAGTLSKIGSKFKGFFVSPSTTKPVADTFNITISPRSTDKKSKSVKDSVLAQGTGSWLSHIEFEGAMFWKLSDTVSDLWIANKPGKLESDSTKRMDTQFIKQKNFDKAQQEKERLENLQRNDAKLRKSTASEPSGKAMP